MSALGCRIAELDKPLSEMEPVQQCRIYGFLSLAVVSLALTLYQMGSSRTWVPLPDVRQHMTVTARRVEAGLGYHNTSKTHSSCQSILRKMRKTPSYTDSCIDDRERKMRLIKRRMTSSASLGAHSRYNKERNHTDVPFELYRLATEIFDEAPVEFISRYKNPCWNHGRDLYCLPYFYVIGMPKCGSSDLYQKLTAHHQVTPGKQKEPAFWNKHRHISSRSGGLSLYMDNFSTFRDQLRGRNNNASLRQITAEGTVASMWSTFDVQYMYDGAGYGLPDILRVVQPEAKFFIILRDPIDRLFSDYHFFGEFKRSPADFHQKVLSAIKEFNKCKRRHGDDDLACIGVERSWVEKCVARVSLGIYSVLLRQWFRVFPPASFFVIKLDRWNAECPAVLSRAYSFLQLDPLPEDDLNKICSRGKALTGKRTKVEMLEETRKILECFYKPYNDDLEHFLDSHRIDKLNL